MIRPSGEENKMVTCPYNKSHYVRLARMQVHLVKCRRNYNSDEKVQCPFDVTHVLNKVELDIHIKICPKRLGFEYYRLKDNIANETSGRDESVAGSIESVDIPKMDPLKNYGSSWDVEPDVPSYNAEIYATNAFILRQPRGLKPSERREFRAKERERLLGKNE